MWVAIVSIGACATAPPRQPENICAIFQEKIEWYAAARASEQRWAIPASVQLAVIYQESSFSENARPPRSRFLWVLPGPRPSSAYGYGQVVDGTWELYKRTGGRARARRDDFADVVDFIGWYGARFERDLGIAPGDARRFYLAYHEGPAGFRRASYSAKPWLERAAGRVEKRAERYRTQLAMCRDDLDERLRSPWWWPF